MTGDRSADVLDLIDGAIDDWTSADAMRWRPAKANQPSKALTLADHMRRDRNRCALVANDPIRLDLRHIPPAQIDAFLESVREAGRTYAEAMRAVFEAWLPTFARIGKVVTDLAEALEGTDGTGPATRSTVTPRVPSYQDTRPRWQTPYGPARRRR